MAKLKNHLKNVSSRRYDEAIFVLLRRALRGFDVTVIARHEAMTVTVFLSCTKKFEYLLFLLPKWIGSCGHEPRREIIFFCFHAYISLSLNCTNTTYYENDSFICVNVVYRSRLRAVHSSRWCISCKAR